MVGVISLLFLIHHTLTTVTLPRTLVCTLDALNPTTMFFIETLTDEDTTCTSLVLRRFSLTTLILTCLSIANTLLFTL